MSVGVKLKKEIFNFLIDKFARKLRTYEINFVNTMLDSMSQAEFNALCVSCAQPVKQSVKQMQGVCLADVLATVLHQNMTDILRGNQVVKKVPEFDLREYTTQQLLHQSSIVASLDARYDETGAILFRDETQNNTQNNTLNNTLNNARRATPAAINNLLGMLNKIDLRNVFNPTQNIIRDYVIFDTRYRDVNHGIQNQFQWGYSDTTNIRPGVVNTQYTIRNLISMRAMQFVFPKTGYYGQTFLNVNTGRVSLFIREFQRQAFVAREQTYYHMIFRTVTDGYTLITPFPGTAVYIQTQIEDYADGMIPFRPPVTEVNTFTFQFQDPINTLNFPPDRDRVAFTYGNPTTITSTQPNNLISGSRVYITDFTTNTPTNAIDAALIAAINDPNGLVITVAAPSTTNTVFTIPVDTSAIAGPIVGLRVECYYAQWRVIIPFELYYLK